MIDTIKNPKKPNEWKVYLSGKKVGVIRRDPIGPVFQYLAGGVARHAGQPFPTFAACVESLKSN